MIKILFVCHGNICRSPMAEFIMKNIVQKNNVDGFYIESRATHYDEIFGGTGSKIYPPAARELTAHNVPYDENKRAQILTEIDCAEYDYIIAMDSENVRYIKKTCPHKDYKKVFKLLSFAGLDGDVSDPWYTRNFSLAYADILLGCNALFDYVMQNKKE